MKILKWYNSDVVYESEKETIREAVIEAVMNGANLCVEVVGIIRAGIREEIIWNKKQKKQYASKN